MKKLSHLGMATFLLGAMTISSISFAGEHGDRKMCSGHHAQHGAEFGGQGKDVKRLGKALDLTVEQKATLKTQREATKEQQKQSMTALHAAHKALMDAADAGAKPAELTVLANNLGKLQGQQALARAQAQQQFIAILTPEQKQKMIELKAKREAKMAERKEKRES